MEKRYKIEKRTVKVVKTIEIEAVDGCSLNQYVGNTILNLRKENGLNQQKLAKILNVSRVSIANMESGKHGLTLVNLALLCEYFNCKSSEILPF